MTILIATWVFGSRPMPAWAPTSSMAQAQVRLAQMTPSPGAFHRPPTNDAPTPLKRAKRRSAIRLTHAGGQAEFRPQRLLTQ